MSVSVPSTETRNARTVDIDLWSSTDVIVAVLDEDARAVDAARGAAPELAALVEASLARLERGGRIRYVGAGASGRLALLDATEATPTFGAPAGLFSARFPGELAAVADSSIDFEDAEDVGYRDVGDCTEEDVVFGISASGETAYVRGALRHAVELGALTALLTANPASSLRELVDIPIVVDTGPEVITGSTRLKAGTMTKTLLNAYSTALMVRAGRTYSNLMVDMTVTNRKLTERGILVLRMASEVDEATAAAALEECDGELPIALLRVLSGASIAQCRDALAESNSVRAALVRLGER